MLEVVGRKTGIHIRARDAFLYGALLAGAAGGLAACSSGTTLATPGGTVHISQSGSGKSGSVQVKTSNGSVQTNISASIPSGFPSSVPLPSGATLVVSSATHGNGQTIYELGYHVNGSLSTLLDHYDQVLSGAEFTSKSSSSIGGSTMQVWKGSSFDVQVITSSSGRSIPDQAQLTLYVSPVSTQGG